MDQLEKAKGCIDESRMPAASHGKATCSMPGMHHLFGSMWRPIDEP
jgi:hypothetical protein